MLTLPSEGYVAEQLDSVDPQRIHAAREAMKARPRARLRADWEMGLRGAPGERRLLARPGLRRAARARQPGLAMLCLDAVERGDAVWPGRAYQRFKDASNMTDRQGALTALLVSGCRRSPAALERFHAMFEERPAGRRQVVRAAGDGARARRQGVRARPGAARHPDFSIANPNRARSLIGAFCIGNPAGFHRSDAAGYVFWADRVLESSAQSAARVADRARARPLDAARRAVPQRRARGDRARRRAAKLSTDTSEIVSRALAAG